MAGRKYIGPRLFLKRDRKSISTWYIIDYGKQKSTGFKEHEKAEAKASLGEYVRGLPVGSRIPALRRYHRKRRARGAVYFISSAEIPRFPIKVGFTTGSPELRLAQLQIGCPYRLVIIGTVQASGNMEADLLSRFADHRMVGEWLRRSKGPGTIYEPNAHFIARAMTGYVST